MNEINIKNLRAEVIAIKTAVEAIRETGISEKALLLLIQHAAPSVNHKKPSQKMISAVIEGMESLEEFVFGEEE